MAKTTIGVLNVKLKATTGAFSRGLSKASKKMGRFRGKLGAAAGALGKLGPIGLAVGLALGVATLGFFKMIGAAKKAGRVLLNVVKAGLSSIDTLGKLASSINATVGNLQALRFAGGISGLDDGQLDKSLKIMVKRIGEVRQGTGEAKVAFDAMNLSVDRLAGLGAFDQFKAIAEGINQIPVAADKAAAANQIFGRSGADLLVLLNRGASGVEAFRKEFEAIGQPLSNFDAAKIEEANDSMLRMKTTLTGVKNQLTVALAPVIGAIALKVKDVFVRMQEFGPQIKLAGMVLIAAAKVFLNEASHIIRAFLKAVQIAKVLEAALLKAARASLRLADPLGKLKPANRIRAEIDQRINTLKAEQALAQKAIDALATPAGDRLGNFLDDVRKKTEQMRASMAAAAKERAELAQAALHAEGGDTGGGPGRFEQIVRSRVSIGFGSGRDHQAQQTNYLRQIANNTGAGAIAR